jgi:hypothetical protein
MKRIASVLLLALILFNWFGYRLVITFMEERANARLESQLDENNYDESQLVSLKIPVKYISYFSGSTTYERVDGQILFNGIQYKYVKRRIFNDSLEVLCIPNHMAMNLKATQNEFFRFSNDLIQEKTPGSHPAPVKSFVPDSYTLLDLPHIEALPFRVLKSPYHYSDTIASCYSPTAEHPPDIG